MSSMDPASQMISEMHRATVLERLNSLANLPPASVRTVRNGSRAQNEGLRRAKLIFNSGIPPMLSTSNRKDPRAPPIL